MNSKILIIDDDEKLVNLLADYLGRSGYKTIKSNSPDDGITKVKKEYPDLVILDVMMPGKNGFEVCKEIRKESSVPIIMLTARGEVTDRIVGLEIGADDYLPKPFEPRELTARIQSVLRRTKERKSAKIFRYGKMEINFDSQTVFCNGLSIELTTMEFEILSYLVINRQVVLDRDKIMEHLKGMECETYDRSIDVLISRLRQKLNDDPQKPKYIKTIRNRGYKFIGEEVEE